MEFEKGRENITIYCYFENDAIKRITENLGPLEFVL